MNPQQQSRIRPEGIENLLASASYSFLRTDPHLGENIILLGFGGSYAYGTTVPGSDIDIRGIAPNLHRDILLGKDFEQVIDRPTDTVIYSLTKIIPLLTQCNPSAIELLGLLPDQYLRITPAGQMLLDNRHLFLSKLAYHSFSGYARNQLRRLNNKSDRTLEPDQREEHILGSLKAALASFEKRYASYGDIHVYLDKAMSPQFEREIYIDTNLSHYPLRHYAGLYSDIKSILAEYSRLDNRRKSPVDHNKLKKHMMHLIRLYYMAIDIFEKEEILTYREAEHDLLMDIRGGCYLDPDGQPTPEFFAFQKSLEDRVKKSMEDSRLPERPDKNAIDQLVLKMYDTIL